MKPIFFTLSICAVLFSGAVAARAQSYSIDWYKIAGGGGTSSNGTYLVSGTIGQADAGSMSGGNYSLTGGFWSLISLVQTPGAPILNISYVGASAIVSWQLPAPSYILENNPICATNGWATVSQSSYVTNGNTVSVTVNPPLNGMKYFRLHGMQ
ncbi:MAG: hypothetical protein JWO95_2531 [Verrucomicrobiales bacterium]|nr:hypothetical protein [Verrucomicrobiales bacterium]